MAANIEVPACLHTLGRSYIPTQVSRYVNLIAEILMVKYSLVLSNVERCMDGLNLKR